jgi:hypothetical protein
MTLQQRNPRAQEAAGRGGALSQPSSAPVVATRSLTLGEAKAIAGSLGFPSKMPGTSYGLPARACIAGAKLAKIPGTVCASCYALNGGANYQMPRAVIGMERRLAGISHPRWVDAMVRLLLHTHAGPIRVDLGIAGVRLQARGGQRHRWNEPGFHRWHDSGDLQSVSHFAAICVVARRTPQIAHWLPTQELGMVRRYLAGGGHIPRNLVVRVSSVTLNDLRRRAWPTTSSVFTARPPADAHRCPAPKQGHECRSCRACWSGAVAHVAYEVH